MLRFRLGPIPIEVHFSHLAISALLAYSLGQATFGDPGWPADVLSNPGHPDRASTFTALMVAWVLMISGSVLVHELGHALASRVLGYEPSIQLVGMGGLTQPNAPGPIPWHKDIFLTICGPLAGFSLGMAAFVLLKIWGEGAPDGVRYVLTGLFYANLFWAVVNLLPVSPLDGGRISAALLTRLLGRSGFVAALVLSILVSAALVLYSFVSTQLILGLIFVMYGVRAVTQLMAFLRGDAPPGVAVAAHPLQPAVEVAEQQYRDGHLAEAAETARKVVDGEPPPVIRSRAHYLLGWIALKVGKGRLALDHFAQVQAMPVAPQALAAGFSLIGDEVRALTLWEQAAAESNEPALRNELAGCLLRMGREADARRVPGVVMSRAWAAAERIAFLRGDWAKAGELAEAGFREAPSADLAYDAACAWAKGGNPEAALRMLALASQNGFDNLDVAEADEDLESLRGLPEFTAWLQSLKALRASR